MHTGGRYRASCNALKRAIDKQIGKIFMEFCCPAMPPPSLRASQARSGGGGGCSPSSVVGRGGCLLWLRQGWAYRWLPGPSAWNRAVWSCLLRGGGDRLQAALRPRWGWRRRASTRRSPGLSGWPPTSAFPVFTLVVCNSLERSVLTVKR